MAWLTTFLFFGFLSRKAKWMEIFSNFISRKSSPFKTKKNVAKQTWEEYKIKYLKVSRMVIYANIMICLQSW